MKTEILDELYKGNKNALPVTGKGFLLIHRDIDNSFISATLDNEDISQAEAAKVDYRICVTIEYIEEGL